MGSIRGFRHREARGWWERAAEEAGAAPEPSGDEPDAGGR